jgi:hypothetical protein
VEQRSAVRDEHQSGFPQLETETETASNCDFNKDSLTLSSDAGGTCDKLWNKWTVFWDVPAV